jgi:hypothetical protein
MRSAARGAHNIIFGAVEDKEKLVNGGFYRQVFQLYQDRKISSPPPPARETEKTEKRLRETGKAEGDEQIEGRRKIT